ncbi:Hypothetical protein I5071_18840 [Sandaracinus amylolyticus]|nr:Hypothetical protein I5071_18840 [Sandaracinus amylolyticus]
MIAQLAAMVCAEMGPAVSDVYRVAIRHGWLTYNGYE